MCIDESKVKLLGVGGGTDILVTHTLQHAGIC